MEIRKCQLFSVLLYLINYIMYERTIKLQDDSRLVEVTRDGEYKELKQRPNNLPSGKLKTNYEEFGIINIKALTELIKLIDNEHIGVIAHMIQLADYRDNSLSPLCDNLSLRLKGEALSINKDRVNKICDKLFSIGVFGKWDSDGNKCWVLNPNVCAKTKFLNDSLYGLFRDSTISKLVRQFVNNNKEGLETSIAIEVTVWF